MTPPPVNLVPGRACGACTVCCAVPAIDTPEWRKPPGVVCGLCAIDWGCTIHERRPTACRDFNCGWRSLPLLDEAWRPDRCGLMIVLGDDPIPADFAPYAATKFIVTGDGAFLSDRRFLSYVSALVHARAAAYLAVQGPPGHHPLKAILNGHLQAATVRQDGVELQRVVRRVFESLSAGPFEAAQLSDRGLGVGDQPPPAM